VNDFISILSHRVNISNISLQCNLPLQEGATVSPFAPVEYNDRGHDEWRRWIALHVVMTDSHSAIEHHPNAPQ
jgi:hypothetical protein